jgi:prepilin-type processing-associated H-X9-DG protein
LFIENFTGKKLLSGTLSDYTMSPSLLCPNASVTVVGGLAYSFGAYPMSVQGFYDSNSSFNLFAANNGAYFLPKVQNPSTKLIHMDGNNWYINASGANPTSTTSPYVEYRHPGKTANILFFDAHVSGQKYKSLFFSSRPAGQHDCWDTYNAK